MLISGRRTLQVDDTLEVTQALALRNPPPLVARLQASWLLSSLQAGLSLMYLHLPRGLPAAAVGRPVIPQQVQQRMGKHCSS